jgi:hypothetical protein
MEQMGKRAKKAKYDYRSDNPKNPSEEAVHESGWYGSPFGIEVSRGEIADMS